MLKGLKIYVWPFIITVVLIGTLLYLTNAHYIEHDFGKTMMGTFVGAWLAFSSNVYVQYKNQYRDDVAAGRRALYTIRSQLDDFLNYRHGLYRSIALVESKFSDMPDWAYAKPVAFNFNSSNIFDYKALSFLLSRPSGRGSYLHLQLIERTYLDLLARHNDFNGSAIDIQKSIAEFLGKYSGAPLAPKALESHLSPELIGRVRSHLFAVLIRLERDEQRYLRVYAKLTDAMEEILGKSSGIERLQYVDSYKKETLPPLPKVLREYLDKIPTEQQ